MRSAAVKRWGGTFVALALGTICISLAQVGLPDGPGRTLTYAKCQGCYGLEYVIDSTGVSPEMWKQSVIEMENLGLELTPQERDTILNYLTTYLGPTPPIKRRHHCNRQSRIWTGPDSITLTVALAIRRTDRAFERCILRW